MKFTNLTRNVEIGANCYALEIAGKRIILDCGMHPRLEGPACLPDLALLADDSVDAVLLTHAHQDHLGSLPVLLRRQPRAPLFATEPTRQIADVMLRNSVSVMKKIRQAAGKTANPADIAAVAGYPLFTRREAEETLARCRPVPLECRWSLDGERLGADETKNPNAPVSFEFFNAGHVLGAAGVRIRGEGRTFFYTGDVNFDDQTISAAATFPDETGGPLDVLVMETTRGDNPVESSKPDFKRADEERRLAAALAATLARGGAALIPVFALGKTQELLAMLAGMQTRGELPPGLPIYIGGLSAKLTELHDALAGQSARLRPRLRLIESLTPFVVGGRDIDTLPLKGGRIYALTSGMMTENTLSNVFAERFIAQPENGLFFIGYADPDSPAGRLRTAQRGDLVTLDERRPPQPLACETQSFDFSAHAHREGIRAWVNRVRPKKIVLVHGDPPAIEWFRQTLSADLPESEVLVPEPGRAVEL